VSRETKKLSAKILSEKQRRESSGLSTHIAEIAKSVGVTPEEASVALCSSMPVRSLDECVYDDDGNDSLGTMLSDEENEEREFNKIAIRLALEKLSGLERRIIDLRYFRDLSQQKTAELLGLTQVKVSREEKKILSRLCRELN
jgi:RNA polymerase sporulation-specific sigma factor